VTLAKSNGEQSETVVHRTIKVMERIEKSSQQIGDIIGVTDEIAFQTNLLALNAGGEAAPAGDASRGFAVVAAEVRALAQRSAEAAKEIKSLMSTSIGPVSEGVKLVAETGQALERILVQVTEMNTVIAAIAVGREEQAAGLADVTTAVNQIDQVAQQNATKVEESTTASRSLVNEMGKLAGLICQFQLCQTSEGDVGWQPKQHATTPRRAQRLDKADAVNPPHRSASKLVVNAAAAAIDEASPFTLMKVFRSII
jgi:methyl-accepting chemotaxis protein